MVDKMRGFLQGFGLPILPSRFIGCAMTLTSMNIAIFVAMGAVFAVLVAGIVNLSLNSDKARSRSNQLMRLRVLVQFFAILLLMLGFWLKTRNQ
jgi:NADH:ubiquinone oxidoreductase subunit 6 (subunit J)